MCAAPAILGATWAPHPHTLGGFYLSVVWEHDLLHATKVTVCLVHLSSQSLPLLTCPAGLQREAAEEEWKSSPPPISEHIVRDDSSEDNEGRGSGSEGEGEGEEEEEEEEQQNFASGWNSVVATTVWLRVLGILGDVSHLPHPLHRQEAMKHIQKTWTLLEKVEGGDGRGIEGGEGRGIEGGEGRGIEGGGGEQSILLYVMLSSNATQSL